MPLDAHPESGVDLNDGLTRPLLPGEDFNAGLYLHAHHTAITTITGPDGAQTLLVSADDFMAMQKEGDDYRRVVGLINAWRIDPHRSETRLKALLAQVGQDDGMAQAMAGLIAWAASADRP